MPLSIGLVNTVQRILVDLRCVWQAWQCHRLMYWHEACAELDAGSLANWGSFFAEAPACVPSVGWVLEWMRGCFAHVW